MKLTGLLIGALVLLTAPAFAATACYTPAQLRAEQLLRLHSELMVITVQCREGSGGEDLPSAYGDFTKKNIRMLHDAEQTMVEYYKENAHGDPVEHLDKLRTILANEFGQKSANMKSAKFCTAYRDSVVDLSNASHADIDNKVQLMEISERSYVKPCAPVHAEAKR